MSHIDSPPPLTPPPQQPASRGMSGCLKAAIIVGILGIIGVGALGFLAAKFVKNGMSMEPAEVDAAVAAMVDIDIGPEWMPAMKMNMGFFNMVVYASVSEGMLMFMEGGKAIFKSEEQFEKQMRSEMSKQNGELEATREVSSNRETFLVGGVERQLLVVDSEGAKSGDKYIELSGTVPGKREGKMVFIYLRSKAADLSVDDLKQMFEGPAGE